MPAKTPFDEFPFDFPVRVPSTSCAWEIRFNRRWMTPPEAADLHRPRTTGGRWHSPPFRHPPLTDRVSGWNLRREDLGGMDLWRGGEESFGVGHQCGGDRSVEIRLSLRISGNASKIQNVWSSASSSA